MTKFTKGPWKKEAMSCDGSDPRFGIVPSGHNLGFVAITASGNDLANANLIAQAPNMYEALEFALDFVRANMPKPSGDLAESAEYTTAETLIEAVLKLARGEGQ